MVALDVVQCIGKRFRYHVTCIPKTIRNQETITIHERIYSLSRFSCRLLTMATGSNNNTKARNFHNSHAVSFASISINFRFASTWCELPWNFGLKFSEVDPQARLFVESVLYHRRGDHVVRCSRKISCVGSILVWRKTYVFPLNVFRVSF